MEEVPEGKDFKFPEQEELVQKWWNEIGAFEEQKRLSKGRPPFVFYDGPPFATGLPHYGHILAGTIKDVVTRYACATGHHVERRFGWDCHGLPIEFEIDKMHKITSRQVCCCRSCCRRRCRRECWDYMAASSTLHAPPA